MVCLKIRIVRILGIPFIVKLAGHCAGVSGCDGIVFNDSECYATPVFFYWKVKESLS